MKRVLYVVGIAALGLAASACDKGSSSDPATVTRDELNPPRGLITVTGNEKVELRWTAGNAEEEFKGYQVFAVKKAITEVAAGVKYPKTGTDITKTSIPRCGQNTAAFELFGIPKSEADCEGDSQADAAAAGSGSSMNLVDDETAATDDKETMEPLKGMVACETGSKADIGDKYDQAVEGNAEVSMPINGQALGSYRCIITKDSEGNKLVNGERYTFFVAAVMGDEYDKISWTSNFVEDSPATPLFSGDVVLKKSVDGTKKGHVVAIPGDKILSLTKIETLTTSLACQDTQLSDATPTTSPAQPSACYVNRKNTLSTLVDGIYFGRLGSGSTTYPQRVFISTPADKKISLLLRGPQTMDEAQGEGVSTTIPGDAPITADQYSNDGTLYPVYGNQVFDLKFTDTAGKSRYGKVVIDVPAFAATTPKEEADITIKVTVIVQPGVDVPHYFW